MLNSRTFFIVTCLTSLISLPTLSAVQQRDRLNASKTGFLDPNNNAQVLAWKAATAAEKNDRDYYVRKGVLAPMGGAYAAAPAANFHGTPINYDDLDSLKLVAPAILHAYGLPPHNGTYKKVVVELLRQRHVPTKAQIEGAYDDLLTPFGRALSKIEKNLDTINIDEIRPQLKEAFRLLDGRAKHGTTNADHVDTKAIVSFILALQQKQEKMLQHDPSFHTLDSPLYKKISLTENLLRQSKPMQVLGQRATPETEQIEIQGIDIYLERLKVSYNMVLQNYDREIHAYDYSLIRLLKQLNGKLTDPAILSKAIRDFLTGTPGQAKLSIILDNMDKMPPSHAAAFFYLLGHDQNNRAMFFRGKRPDALINPLLAACSKQMDTRPDQVKQITEGQREDLKVLMTDILQQYQRELLPSAPAKDDREKRKEEEADVYAAMKQAGERRRQQGAFKLPPRQPGHNVPPPPPPPPGGNGAPPPPPPPPPAPANNGDPAATRQALLDELRRGKQLRRVQAAQHQQPRPHDSDDEDF